MTREEAIKILKAIRVYECYPKSASEETKEAIDMAIEALQIALVQCKDCKHKETDDCPMYWEEWLVIEDCDGYTDDKYIVHDYTTDNGYCNYGERKES